MKTGNKYPQGAVNYDSWQLEYETTITSATQTVTISNLTGDTAEVYKIVVFLKSDSNEGAYYTLRPNNDSGANYGVQTIIGEDSVIYATRSTTETGLDFVSTDAGKVAYATFLLYAKSGYVRTIIKEKNGSINGTTINSVGICGCSWNNTVDEITSLVFTTNKSEAYGIGSYIALYKKVVKT